MKNDQEVLDTIHNKLEDVHSITLPGGHSVYSGKADGFTQILVIFAPGNRFVTACIDGEGFDREQFLAIIQNA